MNLSNQRYWLGVPFPHGLEDAYSYIAEAPEGKKIWAIIFQGRFVGVIGRKIEFDYRLVRSA